MSEHENNEGPGSYSIGEVASRVGLAVSAIRFYESEELLEPAARRSGKRIYADDVFRRLEVIELARAAGFTIAETRELLRGFDDDVPPGKRWRTLAATKREQLEERIFEAQSMIRVLEAATRCSCPSFDACAEALQERRQQGSAVSPVAVSATKPAEGSSTT